MNQDRFRFRVWDSLRKEYIADAHGLCLYSAGSVYCNVWNMTLDAEKYPVEQCTGLKDCNGKLIYEGDVITNRTGRICKVVWHTSYAHCGWDLKALNAKGSASVAYDNLWADYVIIGNIHENTDLLK